MSGKKAGLFDWIKGYSEEKKCESIGDKFQPQGTFEYHGE